MENIKKDPTKFEHSLKLGAYKKALEDSDYLVFNKPKFPSFVGKYLVWCMDNLLSIDEVFQNGLSGFSNYPNNSDRLKGYLSESHNKESIAIAFIKGDWDVDNEVKYYARIPQADLLSNPEQGYWNIVNGNLHISNKWHGGIDAITTLLTKEEWNEFGLNESNTVFRDTPE